MNLWNLKAHIYSLRNSLFFKWILKAEKNNLKKLASKTGRMKGMILDVGTGMGHTLDILPDTNPVICLDKSFVMLNRLNKRRTVHSKIVSSALFLPFKDSSFYFISSIGISEYLTDLTSFYREANRVLKSKGYFLTTISPPNVWNLLRKGLGNPIYTITNESLQNIILTAGFVHLATMRSLMQYQYLFKKT